jgi:hypothetical protein
MAMTRTYAARRLLEHGPLTLREMIAITRWPVNAVKGALQNLAAAGELGSLPAPRCRRTRVYFLAVGSSNHTTT